ncbi:MAG: heme lyase CcmF/NrfE family subunit [Rhodospirillales bacterium]|nr:heme lyase CcmF/NrfE family subunit [Rhodospirillales bacterium]
MIAETGHFALVLALIVALVQGTVPMVGAARRHPGLMAMARPAAVTQFALVAIAFAALTHAYVTSDFSVLNVARNSHSAKPMLYKIAGVWANHEGSMLLWVLILATFGSAVALFGRNLPPTLAARVLSVQAMIAVGFLAFTLLTSNPFERLFPVPVDGRGLNPLLQDPGLAFHPPFLYLGYVGFSMAYSFAIAALIEGRVDATWARWVRPWTLAAWSFLTFGIGLGSWWAYYELGWGGWWFWDPVENASFMPWLAGTALLHSSVVVEKRGTLKGWTVFLAIVTFGLSLLGTFLVRSGVLTSVHTFAADPARGVFILGLLVLVIGGSFALFAWRGPALRGVGLFRPISREGSLLINNLLMTTAAASVLLGTLYPLILDAFDAGKVSVGAPFFNAVFVPLMVPMLAVMAVGPFLGWKRGDLAGALGHLKAAVAIVVVVGLATWALSGGPVLAILGITAALWLAAGTLTEFAGRIALFRATPAVSLGRLIRLPRSAWGMTLAHLGLAVAVAGITASATWRTESIQTLGRGEAVDVAGYTFTFLGVREVEGPNYVATRGVFTVAKDGAMIATLHPETRRYPVEGQQTTEAAIRSTFLGDLYAVIGDPTVGGDAFVTRLYFNPLVPWIWAGVLIVVIGGLVSLSDRRLRVGAPQRRPSVAAPGSEPAPA